MRHPMLLTVALVFAAVPAGAQIAALGPHGTAKIESVTDVTRNPQPAALAGRFVSLSRVGVVQVDTDGSFWVGDAQDRLAIVVDPLVLLAGPGTDWPSRVRMAETVSIQGVLLRRPATMPIPADVYVHAYHLELDSLQ